jgi:CubicO group peptidase (beta-lactamase class C family)
MGIKHINSFILSMEDRLMKSLIKNLILALLFAYLVFLIRCVSDAPFKFKNSIVPEQLNDGWQVASPEDVNISQQTLDKIYAAFISEDQYFNSKCLLVVKDGKLVFETYCRSPKDRDRFSHVQSVTKSFTSLIFGIVRSEGYIDSLDETLYSIMPEKFPSDAIKQTITLRHLLTMTSGLSFDNDVFSVEIYADKPNDPIKYILNKPLYANPGEKFYYRDCDPHLLSYIIKHLTGKTEEQWAKERLFDPLEIRDYYWDSDHTGTTMGAYGLHVKPRDMAKIGQMVLDHGRWNGNQIVDSTGIEASTQTQITTQFQTEPHVYDYGYYWWIVPRWQAFTAWGHGGNFIFIVPRKELVIVMTSMPDVDDDTVGTKLDNFEGLISPLLEEE